MPHQAETTRVVVIGAGFVGSSIAYASMLRGICSELVIIDVNEEKASGEALDLEHGLPFLEPMKVWAGGYDDCKAADVVVIAAGLAQKPGQTRLDLAAKNASIIEGIVDEIVKRTKDAVILVVANPVDVLTRVALKRSGLPAGQVFGSGTVLDSARFRYFLSELHGVSPRSIHAYIIGEHGDSSVACLSHTNISGEPIERFEGYDARKTRESFERARGAAYEIIKKKGATYYGIGVAASEIVSAVLRDADMVMPVSTSMDGRYGLTDVCLSFPSVVGRKGVKRTLELELSADELEGFRASAAAIKAVLDGLPG